MFLLYLLHPSDSFPFYSLLFSCSLFECNCPKFNCNSWYRISFEGIKSWVNSVLIDSATSCSFSWYGISWEGIKSWVNSVHIVSDTSCSFFPLLPSSACIYFSLFFSTLLFFLYLLLPSDSFPFSSLLFSCSLFKCKCPKFNCNSWYRISWEGHEILSSFCSYWLWYLPLFLPSSSLVYNLPSSFQLFFFSFTFSILLILSFSLLYSFHVVSLSALARSLTVIVDIGSLLRELNLELILFLLTRLPPALSVGIGSLEKELNLELILFILSLIPPALSSLFFPPLLVFIFPLLFNSFVSPLPSPSFWFFPFLFSTLFM